MFKEKIIIEMKEVFKEIPFGIEHTLKVLKNAEDIMNGENIGEDNCQQKGVDRMAGNTTNISIRMDADLKAQADALFTELGMNLTTAFNIFVRQSLREGGIPFEVRLEQPNKETVAAMLEAERIAKDPSVKGYNDLDELFADLKR